VFLGRCGSFALLLAFFTIHFGMFHFIHGLFLSMFFPLADYSAYGGANEFVSRYFGWTVGETMRAYSQERGENAGARRPLQQLA
jgi:hypothetical protein